MKNWSLLPTLFLFTLFCCGTCFAQNATSKTPPAKEDERSPEKICPTVSVSCPNDPKLGEPFEFRATIAGGDSTVIPTYNWEVANGDLIEGQGTPTIRVWASGRQGVTATLRVGGFDRVCIHGTASCSTPSIHDPMPPPQKIDSYGLLRFDQVRAKLDRFASVLMESPGAMGFIRGFSHIENKTGGALKAAEDAKRYLVEKFAIEKDRIRIDDGGTQEEFMIELWLIPQGSYLPEVQPKKDSPKH